MQSVSVNAEFNRCVNACLSFEPVVTACSTELNSSCISGANHFVVSWGWLACLPCFWFYHDMRGHRIEWGLIEWRLVEWFSADWNFEWGLIECRLVERLSARGMFEQGQG